MGLNIYDYFINLDKGSFVRDNNAILEVPDNMLMIDDCDDMCLINDSLFYYKYIGDLQDNFQQLASSDLFNHIGIITPPLFLTKSQFTGQYAQISQDIKWLPLIECNQGAYIMQIGSLFNKYARSAIDKWHILYNPELRDYFLTFMTEDCFEKFIDMFLVDELRSEGDRHCFNYFLYKTTYEGKFDGLIPIDFDLVAILNMEDYLTKESFNRFLHKKYYSKTPLTSVVKCNHENNIRNIKKLLDDDKLSQGNIKTIKKALDFDFPGCANKYADHYGANEFEKNRVYTPLSFLWEYNRENLSELGL